MRRMVEDGLFREPARTQLIEFLRKRIAEYPEVPTRDPREDKWRHR